MAFVLHPDKDRERAYGDVLMSEEIKTSYRSCNLCEAICGLVIEHDGRRVFSIKGDQNDPLSRGHLCPKAIALRDIHDDPDRLRRPMRKTSRGFEPISWKEAFDIAEEKMAAIRAKYGDDSVATYSGNPTVHNYGAMIFQHAVNKAVRSKNIFTASSLDQRPHHFVANQMFGHGLLLPVPDVDHTQYMMILGANPAVSNGSLMTAPGIKSRLEAIQRRGHLVLIDPRASETSKLADEHHFIRPGNDVYFLAGMLHVIFERGLTRLDRQASIVKNIDRLRRVTAMFPPNQVAERTGISGETIERLAVEFASTEHAVVYGRLGVSTQLHGGVCQWLINAMNLVTGNLDRKGGQMFTTPAVSLIGRRGTGDQVGRWHSRVRGLPELEGELPSAVMAEEILTPGKGQVRALVTNAGNPVLSAPNGHRLDRALERLDFYVAIDIFVNESTRHADLILPPAAGLETEHYDLAFNVLAVRNVAKFSQQTLKPDPEAMFDWQIMRELALRWMPREDGLFAGIKRQMNVIALRQMTPKRLLQLGLFLGPYGALGRPFAGRLNLRKLYSAPHGIDLGELKSVLPDALRTDDRKVDAAPAPLVERLSELTDKLGAGTGGVDRQGANEFSLIGRRDLRSNNSWMHRFKRLTRGPNRCTLQMHPGDATQLGLRAGERVVVKSRVGEILIPLETSDSIMPGVVSIPHGYGHHRGSEESPSDGGLSGVSVNDITDDQIVDSLTGNAAFSGQRVVVARAPGA